MTVTQKPYSGPRKLVLAFDVGTTYSGISYCILQPGQVPELRGVTRFPGQGSGQGNAKVPSILYYDANGNVKAAGSQALTGNTIDSAMDKGWTKAEWWKLHLRPKHLASAHIKEDDIPPLPRGKSAVDVLTDFIKYLFDCTRRYIQEHHIGFSWSSIENSIEFIFSHPNGWEGRQQQQYREAIQRAGLVPPTTKGQSRVHMITEGEASLHYCVSSLPMESANHRTQGIAIIDAGGGTIDLSMYSMTFNPVSCSEAAPAECRLQGSVFVTRRGAELLKRKLKGSPHYNAEELEDLTREFDQNTKLTICSADQPAYVKIGGLRYNNPRYGIKRGALTLTGAEASGLFNESIKAIIDAFEQQRKAAKTKITMAFLVGGLGTNEYLWTRLLSHFQTQGIKISRPDNDINKAVPNGAVLFHINRDNHLVRARVARITYGTLYSPWADESNWEHRRRRNKWQRHLSGKYTIPGGFDTILLRGNQIDEENEIRHSFSVSRRDPKTFNSYKTDITCYRGALSDPQWVDEDPSSFSELCNIHADLRKAAANPAARRTDSSGMVYYTVDFDVVASFGKTELTAQIAWEINGREKRSPATIVYYDDNETSSFGNQKFDPDNDGSESDDEGTESDDEGSMFDSEGGDSDDEEGDSDDGGGDSDDEVPDSDDEGPYSDDEGGDFDDEVPDSDDEGGDSGDHEGSENDDEEPEDEDDDDGPGFDYDGPEDDDDGPEYDNDWSE